MLVSEHIFIIKTLTIRYIRKRRQIMNKRFQDKIALITGGSGGIGKETAKKFLEEGGKVAIVDINEEALEKVKEELSGLGEVLTIKADVSKEEDVKNYVNTTVDKFGKIDFFHNNAGINGPNKPLAETSLEEFETVMRINSTGVFLGLKYVLPVMAEKGSGSVVNTSSGAGLMGTPTMVAYGASKHAVVGMTKTAALEYAKAGVRVNSVHPAPVNNEMMRAIESQANPDDVAGAQKAYENAIPLGRYAESEEIADLILFLASDKSKFITGSQYTIDGGMQATA